MTEFDETEVDVEPESAKEPETFRVMSPDGRRVLFEGNEQDARDHVQQNYPRVHVSPGAVYGDDGPPPDVHLTSKSGKSEYWNGVEWTEVNE
jgi:hypothetical protein